MSLAPSQPERVGWCPGALRPMRAGDGLLVRVKPRGGRLAPATLGAIAALAERYGNGVLTLTSRANLQLRGVAEKSLPALTDALGALGLLDDTPEAEAVRNVVSCPFSFPGDAVWNAAAALEHRLGDDPASWRLPAKFAWAVDGPGELTLGPLGADVNVTVTPDGCGVLRLDGDGSAAIVEPHGLAEAATRLADAFLALCAAHGLVPHRMRDLVAVCGADPVFRRAGLVATQTSGSLPRPDVIGPYRRAGGAGIGVAFPFGLLHATTLARVAEIASPPHRAGTDEGLNLAPVPEMRGEARMRVARPQDPHPTYRAPFADAGAEPMPASVRLTPWRAMLLQGVVDVAALAETGAIVDPNDPRLGVAACVGAPGCGRASTPVPADAARLAAVLPAGTGVRLHVSGCAKGCAHAGPANVTLVGREGAYDMVLGGRAGDRPARFGLRPADLATMLPSLLEQAGA